ncbi:hypothetical protein LZ32DRAFT_603380 [Colletotrichum eremochloae]|nr:hypothetical protein LZ32DRAFT_603380 [Colletotrichum eremochloae]
MKSILFALAASVLVLPAISNLHPPPPEPQGLEYCMFQPAHVGNNTDYIYGIDWYILAAVEKHKIEHICKVFLTSVRMRVDCGENFEEIMCREVEHGIEIQFVTAISCNTPWIIRGWKEATFRNGNTFGCESIDMGFEDNELD